jgi:hypothetical protein
MKKVFDKLSRYFGSWKVGIMNPNGGMWSPEMDKDYIPYLKAMNARGYHIFMTPDDEGCFLLLDDIPQTELGSQRDGERYRAGRLVVETSPGNFQVWIKASRKLSNPEKRYWIRHFNSDTACDPNQRWGRCPGFRNNKPKYQKNGRYPLSRLIWVDWKEVADVPKVDLPKAPETDNRIPAHPNRIKLDSGHICRGDYDRGDESATDFSYVLALLRRGFGEDDITQRLLSERHDWKNHKGDRRQSAYINRTIKRAVEIINQ